MSIAETTTLPVREMTTSMVLTHALEKLNAVGWCQGQHEDRAGRMCAGAAIHSVVATPVQAYQAYFHILMVTGSQGVPRWNDLDTTTWEEVQHVFNQAIKASTPKDEINGVN